MPEKYERMAKEDWANVVEDLGRMAGNATELLQKMENGHLDSPWMSWIGAHDKKLSALAKAIAKSAGMIEEQVIAKKRGRPSEYDAVPEISAKTAESRKKRERSSAQKPAKKKGA